MWQNVCLLCLGQEDAWIWAVHLQLTVMKEVLTYIFHTPPSSPSVRPPEVQKAPQTSPRNLPWSMMTFDLWWIAQQLGKLRATCIAIATGLRNLNVLYALTSRPCSIRPDWRWVFPVLPLYSSQKRRGSDKCTKHFGKSAVTTIREETVSKDWSGAIPTYFEAPQLN